MKALTLLLLVLAASHASAFKILSDFAYASVVDGKTVVTNKITAQCAVWDMEGPPHTYTFTKLDGKEEETVEFVCSRTMVKEVTYELGAEQAPRVLAEADLAPLRDAIKDLREEVERLKALTPHEQREGGMPRPPGGGREGPGDQ